jgi:3-hydroxyacyl-[acyl-carrier-protein] dehydratase
MTETTTLETVEIQELLLLLPHRYPFLMIDRIIDIESDDRATGIKNVTVNEPHFTGHFPGQPIMPGVLVIEAMAQTCGAIVAKRYFSGTRKSIYFMTIDNAKFRRPVVPGDVLAIKVEKLKERGAVYRFACEAYVGRDKAAQAIISAMLSDTREPPL